MAAKAAGCGETVTEVIVRAFTAYIQDAAPTPARTVNTPPGLVPFREPAQAQPPAERKRCRHPGTRVIGGYCRECEHLIEPGGHWKEP